MSGRLYNLLCERMVGNEVGLDESVTIAELHKRLLPYHACRDELQFATKAEYDLELLQLLGDNERVEVSEPALADAVLSESREVEPGLGFLQRFAASEIRLKQAPPATEVVSKSEVEPEPESDPDPAFTTGCRACGGALPTIEGVRYCPACGQDQVIPTCDGCDAELDDNWSYCALCGILIGS